IAQKMVTVMFVVSFRPMSCEVGTLSNCCNVHACVHVKAVVQAASAPGTPSCPLKLNLPGVDGRAPMIARGAAGHVVVVVLVVVAVVVVVVQNTFWVVASTNASARAVQPAAVFGRGPDPS